MKPAESVIHSVITATMRPFVRLLLRYGVSFADLSAIQRKLFVEVAESEFRLEGRKQSDARIAVLTGLTRREVKKLRAEVADSSHTLLKQNRAVWALSGWAHDPEFLDQNGQQRPLSITDPDDGFQPLIKRYCGDIPFRAILDELLKVGAVKKVDRGFVVPTSAGYVPSQDSAELLQVSFQSVSDLISTIDFNDQNKGEESRLQLTVHYDNVTDEGLEIFRLLSREKGKELLHYLDGFLATYDRDTNPERVGTGKSRTGLSVFYFEEKQQDSGSNE